MATKCRAVLAVRMPNVPAVFHYYCEYDPEHEPYEHYCQFGVPGNAYGAPPAGEVRWEGGPHTELTLEGRSSDGE